MSMAKPILFPSGSTRERRACLPRLSQTLTRLLMRPTHVPHIVAALVFYQVTPLHAIRTPLDRVLSLTSFCLIGEHPDSLAT